MCMYLYIHNKYTQYTHIYYVNKNAYFGLIAINRLRAHTYIYIYTDVGNQNNQLCVSLFEKAGVERRLLLLHEHVCQGPVLV